MEAPCRTEVNDERNGTRDIALLVFFLLLILFHNSPFPSFSVDYLHGFLVFCPVGNIKRDFYNLKWHRFSFSFASAIIITVIIFTIWCSFFIRREDREEELSFERDSLRLVGVKVRSDNFDPVSIDMTFIKVLLLDLK